jgi:ribosome maturation factor RimP
MTTLQSEIEQRLAAEQPEVEVLLAEVLGGTTLRIYIDHPQGVTLALCEQVTAALSELRERYTLEVSSPGLERPLTKPDHFRRFKGRRARVRTRRPLSGLHSAGSSAGRRSFTGELVGATDSEITLAADEGVIAIPYAEIRRSNLVEE